MNVPTAAEIAAHRAAHGLTVRQAARSVGVAAVTWERWEAGTLEPSGKYVARLQTVMAEARPAGRRKHWPQILRDLGAKPRGLRALTAAIASARAAIADGRIEAHEVADVVSHLADAVAVFVKPPEASAE